MADTFTFNIMIIEYIVPNLMIDCDMASKISLGRCIEDSSWKPTNKTVKSKYFVCISFLIYNLGIFSDDDHK